MLPQMVTDVAEFSWNSATQHFETRIYAPSITGDRKLVAFYSTPPHTFLAAFAAQGEAIAAFEADSSGADVVELKLHG